ncbi:MAG: DNA polymerase III subunit, partial [Planctomycetota bacterium]
MGWDELIGQAPAKKYLRSVLCARRQAHAYLFKGPAGVGKRTAARSFAQALLCQQRGDGDAACGQCRSCHALAAGTHPDFIPLRKFTDAGGEVGDHETVIRLETVQFVCEQLHRSPMSGPRRVVVLPEAQRLCQGQAESANAFLKTLEEPPHCATLILTSSQPEGLLETIVSRLQAVQFRRLSAAEVRAGLALRAAGKPEADRELVVPLADGSLGRALELLEGDLSPWRAAVLNGLGKLAPAGALQFGLALWALAQAEGLRLAAAEKEAGAAAPAQAAESGEEVEAPEGAAKTELGWRRYVFRRLLEVCEVCFRDSLVCAACGTVPLPEAGPAGIILLQPDQQGLSQVLARKFGAFIAHPS